MSTRQGVRGPQQNTLNITFDQNAANSLVELGILSADDMLKLQQQAKSYAERAVKTYGDLLNKSLTRQEHDSKHGRSYTEFSFAPNVSPRTRKNVERAVKEQVRGDIFKQIDSGVIEIVNGVEQTKRDRTPDEQQRIKDLFTIHSHRKETLQWAFRGDVDFSDIDLKQFPGAKLERNAQGQNVLTMRRAEMSLLSAAQQSNFLDQFESRENARIAHIQRMEQDFRQAPGTYDTLSSDRQQIFERSYKTYSTRELQSDPNYMRAIVEQQSRGRAVREQAFIDYVEDWRTRTGRQDWWNDPDAIRVTSGMDMAMPVEYREERKRGLMENRYNRIVDRYNSNQYDEEADRVRGSSGFYHALERKEARGGMSVHAQELLKDLRQQRKWRRDAPHLRNSGRIGRALYRMGVGAKTAGRVGRIFGKIGAAILIVGAIVAATAMIAKILNRIADTVIKIGAVTIQRALGNVMTGTDEARIARYDTFTRIAESLGLRNVDWQRMNQGVANQFGSLIMNSAAGIEGTRAGALLYHMAGVDSSRLDNLIRLLTRGEIDASVVTADITLASLKAWFENRSILGDRASMQEIAGMVNAMTGGAGGENIGALITLLMRPGNAAHLEYARTLVNRVFDPRDTMTAHEAELLILGRFSSTVAETVRTPTMVNAIADTTQALAQERDRFRDFLKGITDALFVAFGPQFVQLMSGFYDTMLSFMLFINNLIPRHLRPDLGPLVLERNQRVELDMRQRMTTMRAFSEPHLLEADRTLISLGLIRPAHPTHRLTPEQVRERTLSFLEAFGAHQRLGLGPTYAARAIMPESIRGDPEREARFIAAMLAASQGVRFNTIADEIEAVLQTGNFASTTSLVRHPHAGITPDMIAAQELMYLQRNILRDLDELERRGFVRTFSRGGETFITPTDAGRRAGLGSLAGIIFNEHGTPLERANSVLSIMNIMEPVFRELRSNISPEVVTRVHVAGRFDPLEIRISAQQGFLVDAPTSVDARMEEIMARAARDAEAARAAGLPTVRESLERINSEDQFIRDINTRLGFIMNDHEQNEALGLLNNHFSIEDVVTIIREMRSLNPPSGSRAQFRLLDQMPPPTQHMGPRRQ